MLQLVHFVVAILAALLCVVSTNAIPVPPNMPCINWKAWNYNENTPNINELFVAANAWVMEYSPQECSTQGQIVPCWNMDQGTEHTFGHHDYNADYIPNDYCRIWTNFTNSGSNSNSGSASGSNAGASVYEGQNFLLPFKGPKYDTHSFVLVQTGGRVPDDVIRVGNKALALSTQNAAGQCAGKGFSGWAEIIEQPDGTEVFGYVHFSIVADPVTTTSFQVAVCKAYTNPPPTTTPVPPAPTTTQAPPTLPPNNKPYIRFAHAVPTTNKVTATITQGAVTKTWSCYSFAQFSNWEQHFSVGDGLVTISSCSGNSTGQVLVKQQMYLPPGPIVIAIKGYWSGPNGLSPFSLEGIAASYVPAQPGFSGVRLFNLMPDVVSAGMSSGGKTLVDGVKFTLGSNWAQIPAQSSATFTAFDDVTGKTLTSDTFQAPSSPFVFTNFLLGMANATSGSVFAPTFVPLIDAPENQ